MKKTWLDWVVEAMAQLGGDAVYEDLYNQIQLIRPSPFTKQWKATVRKTIENNSSDSDNFRENNQDVFKSVGGKGSGHWALR